LFLPWAAKDVCALDRKRSVVRQVFLNDGRPLWGISRWPVESDKKLNLTLSLRPVDHRCRSSMAGICSQGFHYLKFGIQDRALLGMLIVK
jgi:hypothetical protein